MDSARLNSVGLGMSRGCFFVAQGFKFSSEEIWCTVAAAPVRMIGMNRRQVLAGLSALPLLGRAEAQSKPGQVIHRVSAASKVGAPMESLDLGAWAFHLTSEEYVSCAPEHHGSVQAALPDGKRVFVSVETIGGSFMAHQYVPEIAERSRMRAVSSSSQLWWGPALPTAMKVTWDVKLEPLSRKDCQLRCEILVETADEALLAAIARQPAGAVDSVQAHCSRETPMFAADMERKALKGIYVG